MCRLGVRVNVSFGWERWLGDEKHRNKKEKVKAITIVDRDACCEAQSDSRLGTNTDFLDGISFGEMYYLGWCLYQVAIYYVDSSHNIYYKRGIPNSIPTLIVIVLFFCYSGGSLFYTFD